MLMNFRVYFPTQVTTQQWDDLESKEETHFLLLKSSFKVEKEALEKMVN